MQILYFECKDKHLNFKNHSRQYFELVSDNDDYVVNIDIQDERRNAMFLRLVFPNGEWRELTIPADGNVEIPLWALAFKKIKVGVTSAGYATAHTNGFDAATITVRGSIKSICGEEYEIPEQSTVEQLIALVNSIETLPPVTQDDNGKVVKVVNGAWTVAEESGGGINFTTDETLTLDANNVLKVNTTNTVAGDNTLPITAAGVYTQVGNINALLATI